MFRFWGKEPDEQILKHWEKAETIGRRNYIIRYGLLGFGSYMFVMLSLFLYTGNGIYSFTTFVVCLITGIVSGLISGIQSWKRLSMRGKNIKYQQLIDAENDEYAKES